MRLQSFRRDERPVRGVYAKAAVFSGNKNPYQQDPTGLHYVFANSPVIASEAGYLWDAPTDPDQAPPVDRKVYPGIYRFGGIVNYNGLFTNPLTGQVYKGIISLLLHGGAGRVSSGSRIEPGTRCDLRLQQQPQLG